jgi:hypothetical protein
MKIEIELSEKLYRDLSLAAKNLNMTRKQFVLTANRRMTASSHRSADDVTASLNKFLAEYPDANKPWWEERWEA